MRRWLARNAGGRNGARPTGRRRGPGLELGVLRPPARRAPGPGCIALDRAILVSYMAIRTVRLDPESERALAEIQHATGTSVSGALKRGLIVAREALREAT